MKTKIVPITLLRNTNKIDELLQEDNRPIYVTKNGFADFVIVPAESYEEPSERLGESTSGAVVSGDIPSLPQDECMGFVRAEAASIHTEVCGVKNNVEEIKKKIKEASEKGVKVLLFPELTLSSYTAGDMFFSKSLLDGAEEATSEFLDYSKKYDMFISFGAPVARNNSLYNCAINIHKGKILGITPKTFIPNYSEFYEKRYFQSAPKTNMPIVYAGQKTVFGTKLIYINARYRQLKIAVEICEDAWVPNSPSINHCLMGANVILNLSASNEVVGKKEYREKLVTMNSAKSICAYCYADAGEGESTTDLVFSGHNIISENGKVLSETELFKGQDAIADIDLEKLESERVKTTSFENEELPGYQLISFEMKMDKPVHVIRHYAQNPFIPESKDVDLARVQSIIDMQAEGLAKRLKTVRQKKVVLGMSGGLDSTLALLVSVESFKKLGYDLKGIEALTMPAFGTSKRTHDNAKALSEALGVSFREISIKKSVIQHLEDIGHPLDQYDVTYENAQARERTQVLMDVANNTGSLMVGTGDLSELCLGWCTFNGDHMSMYGVNASIPKTLVRYLCRGYALLHPEASVPLTDIIETPISPELLPTNENGQIAQLTEDTVGPYELQDFFIYHFLRFGYRPKKLYFLAKEAYQGKYEGGTIKKWLTLFFKRFFQNEFKRSCLPDGAKVGTVAISPRGDLRMPSDANSADYIEECNQISD